MPQASIAVFFFLMIRRPPRSTLFPTRRSSDPNVAIIAVAITTIWLTLGFNIIVLLAGLQSIPEELFESARLDGATGLRSFRHLTVPLLSPSLFFLGVVDTINVF